MDKRPARQRNERVDLRVSSEERAMLTKLAARDGVSVSTWIRSQIRSAFRSTYGDVQPRMPKRPRNGEQP